MPRTPVELDRTIRTAVRLELPSGALRRKRLRKLIRQRAKAEINWIRREIRYSYECATSRRTT